jgi:nitroreductase
MEFFDLIRQRHSIRAFDDRRGLEQDKLEAILNAARSAPSAGNLQSYEVYVVKQVRQRAALAKAACAQGHVLVAPVSLVFCAHAARGVEKFGERANFYSIQDATIACAFALLAACDLKLATVWVGSFDPDAVRQVIGAPADQFPTSILPLGYPDGEPEVKERRSFEDIVHFV